MTDPNRHSLLEDAQGIAYGAGMAAFAITILTHLGPGVATLLAGLVAMLATFAWTSRRDGHTWLAAVAFLVSAGVMGVLLLGVFFTVEG